MARASGGDAMRWAWTAWSMTVVTTPAPLRSVRVLAVSTSIRRTGRQASAPARGVTCVTTGFSGGHTAFRLAKSMHGLGCRAELLQNFRRTPLSRGTHPRGCSTMTERPAALDAAAYTRLYESEYPRLVGYARTLTGHPGR